MRNLVKPRSNLDKLVKMVLEAIGQPSHLNKTLDPDDTLRRITRSRFIPMNSNPGSEDAIIFGSGERSFLWDGTKRW